MLPDLNRLKIFSLIYINKSVSGAARELNLTQPAVSQHLKKLEKELRIPLFTRTKKKMVPTPAAVRLFKQTAPFIAELQKEVRYLRRPLDTPYGQLRIGSSPIFGRYYLPIICSHFRFRFPTVTFKIKQNSNNVLLNDISKGDLDAALVEQPRHTGMKKPIDPLLFSSKKLLEEELVLVGSKNYYQRHIATSMNYNSLKKLSFISLEGEYLIDHWFRYHYRNIPFDLEYALECDDQQSVISAIRCGMGLGVTPYHIVKKEVEAGTIAVINPDKRQLKSDFFLVQLKNKQPSLTEKAFISILIKELEKSTIGKRNIPPQKQTIPPVST